MRHLQKLWEKATKFGPAFLIAREVAMIWVAYRVIEDVIIGAKLQTIDNSTTMLQLDLLQAIAILIAASALTMTVTMMISRLIRELEIALRDAQSEAKHTAEWIVRHEKSHPEDHHTEEIKEGFQKIKEQTETIMTKYEHLLSKHEELASENEMLRNQIKDTERQESGSANT